MLTDALGRAPSVGQRALEAVFEPLAVLVDPGQRLFVGYLLSSAAIACGVWWFEQRALRASTPPAQRPAFRRGLAVLLGPSSRLDVQLFLVNRWLRALLLAPALLPALGVMATSAAVLEVALGPSPRLAVPGWAVAVGYTLVAFVADDFTRFLLHRLLHRLPRLWQLHQVHHSASALTPLTLHRIHPLEVLMYSLRASLVTGAVAGVFFYLFRDTFGSVEVLGINALGFAFNALGANLRHSHVYLSYGPGLERWLISPAQHHLHHARAARYHNKNFGSCLAIWDRLAGTLSLAEGREAHRQLRLGLASKEANHGQRLLSALLAPVRGAVLPARSPGAEAAERARTSV